MGGKQFLQVIVICAYILIYTYIIYNNQNHNNLKKS